MKTNITFILDRSGSMASILNDTIGGFNTYVDEIKKTDAKIEFSLVQFDTQSVDRVQDRVKRTAIVPLSRENFVPRGGTPLIDTIYETIKEVERQVEGKNRKVVISVMTDGQENSSVHHTFSDLKELIADKEAIGWQFNFMGAGINAYDEGMKMGFARSKTISYNASDIGATRAAYAAAASATMDFALYKQAETGFSAKAKLDAGDKFDKGA